MLAVSHRAATDQITVVRAQLERLRGTVGGESFSAAGRTTLTELGRQIEENPAGPR